MAEQREALLAAASARFQVSELAGLELDSLIDETGVSREKAQEFFPTRDDLIRAVYERVLVGMAQDSFAKLPATGLQEQLEYLLRCRYEFIARHKQSSRHVLLGAISEHGGWRDPFEDQFWRFSIQVVALLQGAKRAGKINATADEALAARAFVSFYLTGVLLLLRSEKIDANGACEFTFPLVNALLTPLR
ncbi:MAG: TetR/AcrR family transcriptional regulator [Pseudodesulfovibrio sp.]|uniref:Regulatory protein TetR n=1 Tax=Pseudodesulfovibrio aespoeensis (strain ATCC 700646 / DSM 10631 / Aspo-2) TaxID=643562 RepID=E6VTV3_PSEA9|nr:MULTISPECIES: TetR/AcrR family transcriptional regulator [Pseudodesulfovibrio]MBU4191120.1 TetR/AcrR family transcriptional regulator [Pseudomonadota bacterium]ADU61045.1 hypothetical protein Daes_0016 [Pseudodesulfovibrio aespoeensis Aspo-2]MBU4242754.1 TetR/AcrR family transcriptional regulator [Pseudomonadota bacterium]MBU4378833.1 TetR/AcrR family transcriptional regulator [Pseudomonadota bacterium]MBU4476419.1 TetR/AcrR family transcriptional regulator [Pseudomonadota bacterium]